MASLAQCGTHLVACGPFEIGGTVRSWVGTVLVKVRSASTLLTLDRVSNSVGWRSLDHSCTAEPHL